MATDAELLTMVHASDAADTRSAARRESSLRAMTHANPVGLVVGPLG
jgi:hypothetical protein